MMTLRAVNSLLSPLSSVGLAGVLLLGVMASGCENPNEAFNGRWGPPRGGSEIEAASLDLGAGAVWPQLHLGHYGQEVAGVATFHTSNLVTTRSPDCSCAFVEHQHLDLDAQTLVVTTTCEALSLDWDLAIRSQESGEIFLEGTVTRADGQGEAQAIVLERLVDVVDPFDPFCEMSVP